MRPRLALHAAGPASSTWRLKKILVLLMVAGGLSYVIGSGTFALLNTGVRNTGSSMSTGTLTFNNTVNSGTTCYSWGTGTTSNTNSSCAPFSSLSTAISSLSVAALSAAVSSGDAIKLTSGANTQTFTAAAAAATGSKTIFVIPATPNFAYPTGSTVADTTHTTSTTLSSALASTITSLPVTALTGTVTSGDSLTISYGTHTQTTSATATASSGATAISVSLTPNFAYPTGSTITDTTHTLSTTLGPSLFYPGQTETANVTITDDGSLSAGDLSMYMPTCTGTTTPGAPTNASPINPCTSGSGAEFYVEETNSSGTPIECWYPTDIAGACTPSDASTTLSSALSTSSAITSIPVAALTGSVYTGDTVTVTSSSGVNSQNFTVASPGAVPGGTSIPVVSETPNFAYPATTSTVADTTYAGSLDGFASNYDVVQSELDLGVGPTYGQSRYFVIGLRLPSNAGNGLQGQMAQFTLDWYLSSL